MKYKRGEVYLYNYPSGRNRFTGKIILKKRPMVVLRDSNKNPDVAMLVYCTTQNKSLEYECIEILKGSDEFFEMGLSESTYIVPEISKALDVSYIIEPLGHCSKMDEIDAIIDRATNK